MTLSATSCYLFADKLRLLIHVNNVYNCLEINKTQFKHLVSVEKGNFSYMTSQPPLSTNNTFRKGRSNTSTYA